MATQISYVHLSIVNILYTDLSFNFLLKLISAFWMLDEEELFRSAIVIMCDMSVKTSLSLDQCGGLT